MQKLVRCPIRAQRLTLLILQLTEPRRLLGLARRFRINDRQLRPIRNLPQNLRLTVLEEQGRVLSIDQASGSAWVLPVRSSGCAGCQLQSGCGQGLWSRLLPGPSSAVGMRVSLPEDAPEPKVGDLVRVGLEERALTAASAWAYGAPLVGLIGGAVSVAALAPGVGDGWVAMGALTGLVLGVAGARVGSVLRGPFSPVLLGRAP